MLSQELPPTGRGRSTVWTAHISGDSTRTNLKAKTRQLRLDSALSPQEIFASHTANEFAELGLNFPVCGELVLRPRQAGDTDLGSNYASGSNSDLRFLIVSFRFFRSVCHRPMHNGSAGRCRNS
jgi:hypothetical protein